MRFLFKRILLNFYLVLQIFAVSMGLLCGSFSYAETDVLQEFQNSVKEDIPSDVEEVKNSVVHLFITTKTGIGTGTGFILEDELLVTNVHVARFILNKKNFFNKINSDPLSQIEISQEGRLLDVQVTSIQALDPVHDLALLNIKGSEIPLPIKKPQGEVDLKKEELFFVGYPNGKLKAMGQKGPVEIFESEAHVETRMPVSLSAGNVRGASGSPIVNKKGQLMGVLNSYSFLEKKIIFSNNDSLFSLRNAEYGVECSKNKSIKNCFKQMEDFLFKEAEKGDIYAQYQLGRFFRFKKDKKSIKYFKLAAQQGFVLAQVELGIRYFKLKKYKDVLKWFELASQQGNYFSTFQLGEMYYFRLGVPQNYKKAREYFEQAAQQGYADSAFQLGTMYYWGNGVIQDYKTAIEYFEQAAQKGHVDAVFKLGKMYYHGEGVPQDYKTAIEYFEQAVQQGYVNPAFKLGMMYYEGEGVPQDYKKAIEYFELAAQKGHVDAVFQLGMMYYWGEGVPQDFKKAQDSFVLAAQQEHEEAQEYLNRLKNKKYIEEDVNKGAQ